MINAFSTVCLAQLNIENHKLIIIAQDGEDVEPTPVDTIVTASGKIRVIIARSITELRQSVDLSVTGDFSSKTTGERVDFVLIANQPANRSYWIQVRGLGECGETHKIQQTAYLKYSDTSKAVPPTKRPTYYNGLRRGIVRF